MRWACLNDPVYQLCPDLILKSLRSPIVFFKGKHPPPGFTGEIARLTFTMDIETETYRDIKYLSKWWVDDN